MLFAPHAKGSEVVATGGFKAGNSFHLEISGSQPDWQMASLAPVELSRILITNSGRFRFRQTWLALSRTRLKAEDVAMRNRLSPLGALLAGLVWMFLALGCGDTGKPAGSTDGPKASSKGDLDNSYGYVVDARGDTGKSGGTRRILILINGDSPFWDAARAGLGDAVKELNLEAAGLSASVETNDGTPGGQVDKLKQYGSQDDIVAIGISACDAGNVAVADELKKLKSKGVQIVTIDSDIDRSLFRGTRLAFIGTDNLAGGVELGKCAKNLRPDGGALVTFVGRLGAQNAIDRIGGVAKGAGEKIRVLDRMGDDNDRVRARKNVRDAIGNHPDLNILVGIWSYNAPAIADVVKEKGRRKDFTVVAFDAEAAAINAMSEGLMDAMVVQNPYQMGYQGVRLMKALVENDKMTIHEMLPNLGQPDGDLYDTGLKVVVPDEGSPLKGEMFSPKTEFLKLSKFKEWLAKYKLTGS
jgi:ribose transport system substrate-binding protein